MRPKFADIAAWQQAELLMQPAFIRLIDNIRKQLDESNWQGTYQETPIWPEGTSEAVQANVLELRQQLKAASPEQAREIETELAHLPTPYPAYHLCLQRGERQVKVDLWELCYQICFRSLDQPVEIDTQLLDETGDVDWQQLDAKTRGIVEQIFATLPG